MIPCALRGGPQTHPRCLGPGLPIWATRGWTQRGARCTIGGGHLQLLRDPLVTTGGALTAALHGVLHQVLCFHHCGHAEVGVQGGQHVVISLKIDNSRRLDKIKMGFKILFTIDNRNQARGFYWENSLTYQVLPKITSMLPTTLSPPLAT